MDDDDDSTLSNSDSLSENSSASLDHEVRLSNAARSNKSKMSNTSDGGGSGRDAADRDMTEDEVAIMVKNALRKARRAMKSSSPVSDDDDDDEDDKDVGNNNDYNVDNNKRGDDHLLPNFRGSSVVEEAVSDEVDFGTVSSSKSGDVVAAAGKDGGGGTTDIAKRIEEEIQSARAFAEKKYYSGSEGGGSEDGTKRLKKTHSHSSQSVDTADTPLVSNKGANNDNNQDISDLPTPRASPNKAQQQPRMTPRESARERMARSKDKVALGYEKMAKKSATTATTRGGSSSAVSEATLMNANATIAAAASSSSLPPKSPITSPPKTPGQNDYDAILAVTPSQTAAAAGAQQSPTASPASVNSNNAAALSPVKTKKSSLSDDPTMEEQENNNSNNNNANKPPLSTSSSATVNPSNNNANNAPPPLPNTNSNKPREHRQVLFRHPYPLPPPPPLPRSDAVIISSHTAADKEINIRWVEPDNDLAALIEAAGEEYNLVRRSNACGALKVLASKDGNKPKLCRTKGLLDVLVTASWDDAVDSDALDARTRAVHTLLYLAEPKDNRLIVARHPRVLECLVKVVEEDTGEARWRATSTLATLAKTPGNRGAIGIVENLTTVLGELMVVGHDKKEEKDENGGDVDGNNDNEVGKSKTESREDDNSTYMPGEDSMTLDTMDEERMLTQTYTGTFTDGTGTTFTEDDMTNQSAYDSDTRASEEEGYDEEMDDRSVNSEAEEDGTRRWTGYPSDDEECSVQEEEGVEMQISTLKRMNIENASDFLAKSQLSACATLTHLSKHCANAPTLCNNDKLLDNILLLAGIFDSPLHTRCIEMLCNFTRFPSNNARLASMPKAIDTLLSCGKSKIAEDRMWSIRTVQNLCSDASSKVGLATGPMLSLLSASAMRKDYEEQHAAVGALLNLSTEPGSIVPLTNTKTVVATLVHLAHSPNTPGSVRKIACDALATIGLWLQTLASAGTVPEEIPFSPLPTHSATGWLRWEG